ncbi:MAG: hypothetical protein LBH50_06110 [Spirochaetaceae bacterium]|jgi:hypothetical protein|nr:hypothetical protein [Spirochaetaceae bacterium]
MKNFARFLCFFGLWFPLVFIIAAASVFLGAWIDAASQIPPESGITLSYIAEKGIWAMPFALYLTVIFSVNYGHRHGFSPPLVFISAILLAGAFVFGASKCLNIASGINAPPLAIKYITLGRPGLMLSRPKMVITLLDRPSNADGSRVVSIEGRPLIYQKRPAETDGKTIGLPPAPFRRGNLWILGGILSDLSISGKRMATRFDEGGAAFFSWVLALTALLVSLGFALEASSWPFVNILLELLAFRGVLAFGVFINSNEITEYLAGFSRGAVPDTFIAPAIFASAAVLLLIYSILFHLARAASARK